MIEILQMEHSNIEDCVILWKNLIDYHNAIDAEMSINDNWKVIKYQEFEAMLNLKSRKVFIARVFGIVVGYISISIKEFSNLYNRNKVGYVDEIYIEQTFRGRGIGSRLLDKSKNWFESKEVKKIWLNVFASNINGQDFWESNGFKTIGARKEIRI